MKVFIRPVLVFSVVIAFHLLIYFSGILPFFDFRFFDVVSKTDTATSDFSAKSTVVVEIDERSLQTLGQWPWPRIILAKITQEILAQKPAVVGFDIFFPEPDRTSPQQLQRFYKDLFDIDIKIDEFPPSLQDHDKIFADVLSRGSTVLPLFIPLAHQENYHCNLPNQSMLPLLAGLKLPVATNILCNTPQLQNAAQGFGFINAAVDNDGILRRQSLLIEHQNQILPNLTLAMLKQIDPGLEIHPAKNVLDPITISFANKTIAVNRSGKLLNRLYGKQVFKRISAARVVTGEIPTGLFTGKMVLIGASAAGLYDHYMTSAGETIPGVFAHAALLENIIQEKGIYQPEISKNLALILSSLLSTIVIFMVVRRQYLLSWTLYLSSSLASILLTILLFRYGLYISLGYFLTSFSLLFFLISLFFAVLHYVERKRFLEDLGAAHSATIDGMTMVAESRDVETGSHIIRTKEYVATLAWKLSETDRYKKTLTPHIIDLLYRAAPLHDIGKVGIPDAILQKAGKLDEAEIKTMRSHVDIGRAIINNAINSYNKTNEFLLIASNMTYSHHEKWDGSGYPLGLKGEEIPLEGRLMALADVYDALTTSRCYKEQIPFAEAEQMIINDSGSHFDPFIVETFIKQRKVFRDIALRSQEKGEQVY